MTSQARESLPPPLLQNRACQFPGTRLLNSLVLVMHTFDGLPPSFRHGSVGAAVASCDRHLSHLELSGGCGQLLAGLLPCSIARILDIVLVVSSRALRLVL